MISNSLFLLTLPNEPIAGVKKFVEVLYEWPGDFLSDGFKNILFSIIGLLISWLFFLDLSLSFGSMNELKPSIWLIP